TTEWGHRFAAEFLDHIRARMTEFQEQTGHMYNLEATPAEGTTYRFAKEDKKRYPEILQAGAGQVPYYTNSSQLPVGFTDDPFEALERQEALQQKYTGGTVLHLYMSERLSSAAACKVLVRRSLERFRVPYITVTPTFSICPSHGYLSGEHKFCPCCDQEILARRKQAPVLEGEESIGDDAGLLSDEQRQICEVWTRVMGYHRPVSEYNPGKKSEHAERIHFLEFK
ncbi:MAG: anaerobic ribonucleoside-triphosphate reductase, partial [Pseudomonadota bacterium]